jgi:hypothetical protein
MYIVAWFYRMDEYGYGSVLLNRIMVCLSHIMVCHVERRFSLIEKYRRYTMALAVMNEEQV